MAEWTERAELLFKKEENVNSVTKILLLGLVLNTVLLLR